ncbi:CAAX amino terminal protease family protein [delta proteobacterium NaphS2]|nr:CAAX amino terminal protease family protein [delta proteobacterium NaphS2]
MAVATVLWFFAFFVPIGNFWVKITLSSLCLAFLAVLFDGWPLPFRNLNRRAIFWGVLSALFLYGLFMAGNAISRLLFPFAENQVHAIYAKGDDTPGWVIGLVLFFVTSPAEEIFWRGFLQRRLSRRLGGFGGWIMAAVLYAAVHILSLNFMLVGAAGVAGLFWGFLYWRLKSLWPVVISHAVWTCLAFAVAPIH